MSVPAKLLSILSKANKTENNLLYYIGNNFEKHKSMWKSVIEFSKIFILFFYSNHVAACVWVLIGQSQSS